MKQTAVEWIIEQVFNSDWENMIGEDKLKLFEQAKRMEKEQIIQTYHKSALNEATHIIARTSHISAEQYYNETFNTKEK